MAGPIRSGLSTLHKCADCLCDIVMKNPGLRTDVRIPDVIRTAINNFVDVCSSSGFGADTYFEALGPGDPTHPE